MAGRKVLLVDDDRINLSILANMLKPLGFQIEEADSGEQALEVYEQTHPDIVLLDVMLPGMNGFDTCRELHRRHGDDTAPVIFITAKAHSEDVVEGLSAGGTDYLPKPFRAREAVARVRTHLTTRILAERQRSLVEQLTKANADKNKLLGMAAHDLRNPLATICGLTELLLDPNTGSLADDQTRIVEMVQSTSQSMLDLVNELLDIAVIEAGELRLKREFHDLSQIVSSAVALSGVEASRKRTHVVIGEHEPLKLVVDASKIRQVVQNLLSNAVKYSPPASVVSVGFFRREGAAGFVVRDQGPGISDKDRERLFTDFGRLSAKPTGGEKSIGLGLAICRKIVDAHGGSITAENLPGGGCEFRVALPCAPSRTS